MSVHDLERSGLALRLRWLWFSRTNTGRAWSNLELQFSEEERNLFLVSTTMLLGNGATTCFWEDRWIDGRAVREIAPLLYACVHKRRRKARMLAEGLLDHHWAQDISGVLGIHEIGQYLQLWQAIEGTILTEEPDQLRWRWTSNGNYSAKSCYMAMFQGSTTAPSWKLIWKS